MGTIGEWRENQVVDKRWFQRLRKRPPFGKCLDKAIRDDLANNMESRRQSFEPIPSGVVRQIGVVVVHTDGMWLILVQHAVVVQIGVDRHARETRFALVANAIAIFV